MVEDKSFPLNADSKDSYYYYYYLRWYIKGNLLSSPIVRESENFPFKPWSQPILRVLRPYVFCVFCGGHVRYVFLGKRGEGVASAERKCVVSTLHARHARAVCIPVAPTNVVTFTNVVKKTTSVVNTCSLM